MGSSNREWRDQYYVADLKDVIDISEELERHQGLDFLPENWLDASVLAVMRPNGQPFELSTSLSSRTTGTSTVGSSPTSLTTQASMDLSPRDESNSQMTSPTTASQASTSPTSPVHDASTSRVVETCKSCGDKFTGTPQDARSNLTRHWRTSPKHNTDAGLKCPEPDCPAGPMRADNLGPHLRRKHKLTALSELEQAKKKSRGFNTEPGDA